MGERFDQRVIDARSGGRDDGVVLPPELRHDRQRREDLAECVGVSRGGGRLGVVLGEEEIAAVAVVRREERIEPGRRRRAGEARLDGEERFLLRREAELAAKVVVGQRPALDGVERLEQHGDARAKETILPDGQEARPEDRAERPGAEDESAPALLLVEALLRGGGEVGGEQVVVGADGVGRHGGWPLVVGEEPSLV